MENQIIEQLKTKLNNPNFQNNDLRLYSRYPDVMNSATNFQTSVVIELPELNVFAAVLKTADLRVIKTLNPKVNYCG